MGLEALTVLIFERVGRELVAQKVVLGAFREKNGVEHGDVRVRGGSFPAARKCVLDPGSPGSRDIRRR